MGIRILIAEDEEHIGSMVKFKLERSGYEVEWVRDGTEAWSQLSKAEVSLALLDVMMPGLSGFEVLEKMQGDERTKAIPVIMLTARGQESDIVHGLQQGAADYITKPFRPAELLVRVQKALEGSGG